MEYLKWELMDFPTEILDEFGTWDKAHNVYLGRDGAERFMIFDIERGWGRQAIQRTVIARRYANAPRFEPAIEPPFLLLQSQNWRIVTLARTSLLRKPFIGSEAITPRSIEYFLELLAQAKFPDRRN